MIRCLRNINEDLRNTLLTNLKNSKLQLYIRILYCLALLLQILPFIFSSGGFHEIDLETAKDDVSASYLLKRGTTWKYLQRPETTFNEQATS